MPLLIPNSIPCQLCGESLPERTSKRKKPYFVCDNCGTQLFVRRAQGISRLQKLKKTAAEYFQVRHSVKLLEIQRLLAECNAIRSEIRKIDQSSVLFLSDNETRMRKALQKRLEAILSELEGTGKSRS